MSTYEPWPMPPELLKAHRELDRGVMKLYNLSVEDTIDTTDAACVASLMERYRGLAEGAKG